MSKYEEPRAGKSGWTDWIRPIRKGYRMACCDCGLVHELWFHHIPWGRGRKIIFRARRNNRATAAMRRERKKK